MAITKYGVNATLVSNTTPALKVKSKDRHGRMRISYDEYEAASVVVGTQIAMGWVPGGARFLGGRLMHDALGALTLLSVGDQFDCARFLANIPTVGSQSCDLWLVIGDVNLTDTLGLHGKGYGYEFPCDTDIIVTVPYAGGTVTGTIKLEIIYSTD